MPLNVRRFFASATLVLIGIGSGNKKSPTRAGLFLYREQLGLFAAAYALVRIFTADKRLRVAVLAALAVALTLTMVAALRTFDLVYVMTSGGPGNASRVPSYEVYDRAIE